MRIGKEDSVDIIINEAPVAEENKAHRADTSGSTFTSTAIINNNETEEQNNEA